MRVHNRLCGIYKNRGKYMNGYFYTLLVTSVCGTVCSMLAWGGFEKYIKYIAALICVSVMIFPLRSLHFNSGEIENYVSMPQGEYDNLLYSTAESLTEENAKKYIAEIVLSKFGINTVTVNINIDWNREDPTITSISVAVPKTENVQLSEIKDYLIQALGGEVTVIEAEN